MNTPLYRGRFAPSPSGPLHFGSLVAAVGSFVDARAQGGSWLLRIEDLDPPREVPGAAADILRSLEACALHWDETEVYQSQRQDAYHAALGQLLLDGHTFPCACSRKEVADSAFTAEDGAAVYPGTCRHGLPPGRTARAYRLRVIDETLVFDDHIQGRTRQELGREIGDFIIQRADGCIAYQLAVVVDDAWQGITDIVRGADLLDSTPRQLYLQRLLKLPTPRYAHLPVALNERGEKLSKQTRAPAVSLQDTGAAVFEALCFLGHAPPESLRGTRAAEILEWAVANWSSKRIPQQQDAVTY